VTAPPLVLASKDDYIAVSGCYELESLEAAPDLAPLPAKIELAAQTLRPLTRGAFRFVSVRDLFALPRLEWRGFVR
jgi:hypothetical protein